MACPDGFMASVELWPVAWAPDGWAICNGALLSINQYSALFSLLGTTFGGNGTTTFGIPNMQGRVPVGMGQSPSGIQYSLGATGGAEAVTLNTSQLPAHTHPVTYTPPAYSAAGSGTVTPKAGTGKITLVCDPTNNYPGQTAPATPVYTSAGNANMGSSPLNITVTLNQTSPGSVAVQSVGGGASIDNRQPYQVLNYIIALTGIYPTRP